MNGYEKRSIQKKDTIIKAAQELFAQRGVSDASVTDIAAKANVSRVTLFKYFGDKETLAKEAMEPLVEGLVKEYKDIVSSDLPYHQKLLKLFNTRITGREKIGDRFIASTAWEDAQLRKLIYDLSRKDTLPVILDFLKEGREGGYIDPALNTEAIFAYLSAFGPIIENPDYIKKGRAFQESIFNLFMGGLIKNWYAMTGEK